VPLAVLRKYNEFKHRVQVELLREFAFKLFSHMKAFRVYPLYLACDKAGLSRVYHFVDIALTEAFRAGESHCRKDVREVVNEGKTGLNTASSIDSTSWGGTPRIPMLRTYFCDKNMHSETTASK
jgi:hypothetical protein